MPRKRFNYYSQDEKVEIIKDLLILLKQIKNDDQAIDILISTLTKSELITISKRLQIMKGLVEGKTYKKISEETNTGPSTIKTVTSLLNRNNNFLELKLSEYFKKQEKDKNEYFKKGKLYKYPGYELAAKILGIEFINKKIQK